jgi:hypothetical protein
MIYGKDGEFVLSPLNRFGHGNSKYATEDFAQLTGIQEIQNIVLQWKIDSSNGRGIVPFRN